MMLEVKLVPLPLLIYDTNHQQKLQINLLLVMLDFVVWLYRNLVLI